ncbi:MAG: endonuclease/exonuclease/phosphatase family protein [Thalassospira sp.]|uniref:endonuclease/exonuclease/phosphatase family protein n=1 Tax=Thalassospira sp. TaxID=1912094 RepID=UPI0032EC028E
MFPLKILSWNIEHFNGSGGYDAESRPARLDRVDRVAEYIRNESPDIFGISEVVGSTVYEKFTRKLSGYTFNITEGRQSQEILVGVRSGLTAFFTQRNEFKRSNPYLRPGALLTVRDDDVHLPILFTHLKSKPDPEGFGLRDAMFGKIFDLQKELDKAQRSFSGNPDDKSNFIVLGDMNTMGLDYYQSSHDIPQAHEISVVKSKFARRGLVAAAKTASVTWSNGTGSSYPPSDLDHVFASETLQLSNVDAQGNKVRVAGWAELDDPAAQDDWIARFSDHAPLIFEVTGVA